MSVFEKIHFEGGVVRRERENWYLCMAEGSGTIGPKIMSQGLLGYEVGERCQNHVLCTSSDWQWESSKGHLTLSLLLFPHSKSLSPLPNGLYSSLLAGI